MSDYMPIELRLPERLIIKSFRSDGFYEAAVMQLSIRKDVEEWLKERLKYVPECYLTGDEEGNWYYAISLSPQYELIAVEFRLTWS